MELGRWENFKGGSFSRFLSFWRPLLYLSTLHLHIHLTKLLFKYDVSHMLILWNAKGDGLEQFRVRDIWELLGLRGSFSVFLLISDLKTKLSLRLTILSDFNHILGCLSSWCLSIGILWRWGWHSYGALSPLKPQNLWQKRPFLRGSPRSCHLSYLRNGLGLVSPLKCCSTSLILLIYRFTDDLDKCLR